MNDRAGAVVESMATEHEHSPADRPGSNPSLDSALQERGYRLTPQRLMILEAVESSPNHASAEEIYDHVRAKYPYINISTIYRTLELFRDLSIVTETDLGGVKRYHPVGDGQHHHLVCRDCGNLTELDDQILAPVKEQILQEYGFRADLSHLAILGLCARCRHE